MRIREEVMVLKLRIKISAYDNASRNTKIIKGSITGMY